MQFQKISILPSQKGLEFPGGMGVSVRPKKLKKCMMLNWNFQRGGRVLEKIPSVGEVWIYSGITQYKLQIKQEHLPICWKVSLFEKSSKFHHLIVFDLFFLEKNWGTEQIQLPYQFLKSSHNYVKTNSTKHHCM